MYKTLAAAGIAAALLFAVPQGASALPGQGTGVKTSSDVVQAGYKIGDRVVRPAKVTVVDPEPGSEPAQPAEATTDDTNAEGSGASSDQS